MYNYKVVEMNIDSLYGKSVALIGYGVSNRALLEYLTENGIYPTVRCPEAFELPEGVRGIFGDGYLNLCEEIAFRSPSVHPDKISGSARVYTDCELFLGNTDAYKIGITGSDGKTTTTTLIGEILRCAGKCAHVCGNIGVPLASVFPRVKRGDFVVCELSSFQLHRAEIPLDCAVVTSISENHLDYHADMFDYIMAKRNILKKAKRAVVNYDMRYRDMFTHPEITYFSQNDLSGQLSARKNYVYIKNGYIYYNEKRLFPAEIIKMRGAHNVYNVLGAVGALYGKIPLESIALAVSCFSGVEHRNEETKTLGGVKFINSSADTSPARTVTTLGSYLGKRVVAIMGGGEKNLDYSPLREAAKHLHAAILLGENREKIAREISSFTKVITSNDIYEATKIAYTQARPDGYVILTPASTSFDMFENYKDRAEKFKDAVSRLDLHD